MPEGSCKECADITSGIELRVARGALHVPRAIAGYPSRRRKEYPEFVEVTFTNPDHSERKVVKVDINEAPAVHIVPLLPISAGRNDEADELLSCVTFEQRHMRAGKEQLRKLCEKHGFERAQVGASIVWSEFHRLLWKMAAGIFWNLDKDAYLASMCRTRVLTGKGIYSAQKLYDWPKIGYHDHCVDMYSVQREGQSDNPRVGYIHGGQSDDGRWLFVAIDILEPLGFPIYVCRIPAVGSVYPFNLQNYSGPRHLSYRLFTSVEFNPFADL